ncbi:hypothetical protein D3C72_1466290 [compost metagenome]
MRIVALLTTAALGLLTASAAQACSLTPPAFVFWTPPAAIEAEVVRVRSVEPREWEQGKAYEAEFRSLGPSIRQNLPRYRWQTENDCGGSGPVSRGQHVLLLVEGDPAQASERRNSTRSPEDPPPVGRSGDFALVFTPRGPAEVAALLEIYHPFKRVEP